MAGLGGLIQRVDRPSPSRRKPRYHCRGAIGAYPMFVPCLSSTHGTYELATPPTKCCTTAVGQGSKWECWLLAVHLSCQCRRLSRNRPPLSVVGDLGSGMLPVLKRRLAGGAPTISRRSHAISKLPSSPRLNLRRLGGTGTLSAACVYSPNTNKRIIR